MKYLRTNQRDYQIVIVEFIVFKLSQERLTTYKLNNLSSNSKSKTSIILGGYRGQTAEYIKPSSKPTATCSCWPFDYLVVVVTPSNLFAQRAYLPKYHDRHTTRRYPNVTARAYNMMRARNNLLRILHNVNSMFLESHKALWPHVTFHVCVFCFSCIMKYTYIC